MDAQRAKQKVNSEPNWVKRKLSQTEPKTDREGSHLNCTESNRIGTEVKTARNYTPHPRRRQRRGGAQGPGERRGRCWGQLPTPACAHPGGPQVVLLT